MNFYGTVPLSLDGKNRLSMPTKYHEYLREYAKRKIAITFHPQGSLMVYAGPEWEVFSQRISELPMADHWIKRIFLGNANEVDLDSSGRILISAELRGKAKITKETILVGVGKYFELWDESAYKTREVQDLSADNLARLQELTF